VNADGDIIRAWLEHYRALGVSHFRLVVHGPPEENAALLGLREEFRLEIVDTYGGVYTPGEKGRRLEPILDTLADQWVLLVDSDEFVELPLDSLEATIEALEHARADALAAPMVQRIRRDGSLDSPSVIADPFGEFPLCAPDLYRNMGVRASTAKFPLVRRGRGRRFNPGFHDPPEGAVPGPPSLRGVTHHFKWRASVWERLRRRAESQHRYRHESIGYLDYLAGHEQRLPLDGAFTYSREELFRRRLLRRPTALERLVDPFRPYAAAAAPARLLRRVLARLS
jgi:Glycosyl transferase family 2